ncbi:cation efflux family-domain-containing protein [Limtongia smithiae]|uniref:cation efflux family-domain-containing protein n=1 Tax=Limtongia smithiae TaxID=1125753 RepID=UPI0034CD5292
MNIGSAVDVIRGTFATPCRFASHSSSSYRPIQLKSSASSLNASPCWNLSSSLSATRRQQARLSKKPPARFAFSNCSTTVLLCGAAPTALRLFTPVPSASSLRSFSSSNLTSSRDSAKSLNHEHDHDHSQNHDHNDHSHEHENEDEPAQVHNHSHGDIEEPIAFSAPSEHDHDHSHSLFHVHSHASDNETMALLLSKNTKDPGVRITRIGLAVNIIMAVAKGAGGIIFNSKSLLADAAHAVTDMFSDILTLATVSVSLREPNKFFPRGYGKIEVLGSLGVSAMLIVAGFGIGVNAADSLYGHIFTAQEVVSNALAVDPHALSHEAPSTFVGSILSYLHSHSHHHSDVPPDINAAWLAGSSIIAKEWLFQSTMKVAKEKRSTVLAANAWHHRVDSLTSIVALIAITGSSFFHLNWLDPAGGVLVSLVTLQVGFLSAKEALLELADHSAQDSLLSQARQAAEAAIAPGKSISSLPVEIVDLRGTKAGPVISIDLDVRIHGPSVSLAEANKIAHYIRDSIVRDVHGVRIVTVRTFDDGTVDTRSWMNRDIADNDKPSS